MFYSSRLRMSVISSLLVASGALWSSTAAAQDQVFLYSADGGAGGGVPSGATLVVTDYIGLTTTLNQCTGLTWVAMTEVLIAGADVLPEWRGLGRLSMFVGVENPLRTLKRGDRLQLVSATSCNGQYVWHAVVME